MCKFFLTYTLYFTSSEWSQYPGAVDVWKRNFSHVEKLFDYGSAVRKVMYTTNAVESINSGFRKVTKKGAFPNENALLKLLYLRITELYKKWNGSKVLNWAMVQNQLATNDKMKARIGKDEHLIGRCFWPPFSFRYAPHQRRTKNINYLTS